MDLVEAVLEGDRRAVARLITLVENDGDDAHAAITRLYPHTGQAYIIGVTGAPGTGKSTLVNELVKSYRRLGHRVGVIAVDATSPFTGGAILGDRIRMTYLATDPDTFVRSMATRGHLGGLAWTTGDVIKVLDAAGFDIIVVETVGTGQVEVEIAQMSHTVVVVEVPGMGDDIQAIKAGILEIADVFVINKADRPGVERTVAALQMMLNLGRPDHQREFLNCGPLMSAVIQLDVDTRESHLDAQKASDQDAWQPRIVKTIATQGTGIPDLVQAIADHQNYLNKSQQLSYRNRIRLINELERILRYDCVDRLLRQIDETYLANLVTSLVNRKIDPQTAAKNLMDEVPCE